jgi:hypothetical protein
MRFLIHTAADLLEFLEGRKATVQAEMKRATTQREAGKLGGAVDGLDEAIFYLGEHIKTLAEDAVTTE